MGKKKTKSKRNAELRIIFFIILIAAVLFIISTYAWFTTQRNVSITNLQGVVEVAEGLEISLNAKDWANEIVLGEGEGKSDIIKDAYPGHRNIYPVEMLPVSTLGECDSVKDLQMLRGKVTNSIKLSNIVAMKESLAIAEDRSTHNSEAAEYPGYFAFDIFLKNSSKNNTEADILQLNYDASVSVTDAANSITGLQNTVRVGFARYGGIVCPEATLGTGLTPEAKDTALKAAEEDLGIVSAKNTSQEYILDKTGAKDHDRTINDVAIWEPNANDHVEYIIDNNNKITWDDPEDAMGEDYTTETGDGSTKYLFTTTTQMPTHGLKVAAIGKNIADLYDWSGTNDATMTKQITLQTKINNQYEAPMLEDGVQNLISIKNATAGKTGEDAAFKIPPSSIMRMRVYVWLEGQDVDCINYASYGGGITVNIGLVKGSTVGSHGDDIENVGGGEG